MKTILLATTNERKVREAKAACELFDIVVEPIKLDISEIQSADPTLISQNKIDQAFGLVNKPVTVTDTFWTIPALNGFPGGYMKDVANWFSPEDFLSLMAGKKDRRLSFTESICFKDGNQTKVFSREFWGVFSDRPKGTGNSIEQIAEFDGLTIGEKRDQGKLSHDPKEYIWFEFAKWFAKN